MDNINNLDWELLNIDENGNILENSKESELTIETGYEEDINEIEESIHFKTFLDIDNLNELEENDCIILEENSESSLESVCLNDDFELDIELYENEMIQEEQEDYFLREMQQRELDEYIKEEEEYQKYEEEMFILYNNESEYESEYESDSESFEESSYYSSSEESESSEEETKYRNKKRKNRFNRIIDNKFVFCLGAYLIYEIMFGTE